MMRHQGCLTDQTCCTRKSGLAGKIFCKQEAMITNEHKLTFYILSFVYLVSCPTRLCVLFVQFNQHLYIPTNCGRPVIQLTSLHFNQLLYTRHYHLDINLPKMTSSSPIRQGTTMLKSIHDTPSFCFRNIL